MLDYDAEKASSEARDLELGFRIAETELEISERIAEAKRTGANESRQTWNHLSPQIFQTPYDELERIVTEVDPHSAMKTWVDLGAAYGRLGIVLGKIRLAAFFRGIELVPERVREGRRVFANLGLDPETLICDDLATCPLPDADFYFIYDFGTRPEIERVLIALQNRARTSPIVVVGRGRSVRDTIERAHPWLGAVIPPTHSAHHSIYRSG